ncbi:MAG: SPFH domain-containing protein, partial [Oscillospiraceae bacterium]|nr:SPFH domain-containing protein [Oscillospiraceae bacterium]
MTYTNVQHEIRAKAAPGMQMLFLGILLLLNAIGSVIAGALFLSESWGLLLLILGCLWLLFPGWLFFSGLKVVRPNEALVLMLFGKYHGTLKRDGFFFVNPFCTTFNPAARTTTTLTTGTAEKTDAAVALANNKISLKNMTLSGDQLKINDLLGNPVVIGINVIWRVANTAKAVFAVDNYKEFLSIQCDAALRNTVRLYPYDASDSDCESEKTLRGSS